VCGYIRLTKKESNSKEKNVISISLAKKFQSVGIGTHAYKLFEDKMKEIGVTQIVALTLMIAVSKPQDKDIMIKVILNLLM